MARVARKKREIQMEMRPGEELIWAGSPKEGKDHGRADWLLIPLSVIGLAVSTLYAMLLAVWMLVYGFDMAYVPSIAIWLIAGGFSVYAYFFRFAVKRRNKADLAYGVTNQHRVLIRDTAARKMYVLEGKQLKEARITEKNRKGVGTIYLRKKTMGNWLDNTGLDFFGNGTGRRIALYDIPDCQKVYKLICKK